MTITQPLPADRHRRGFGAAPRKFVAAATATVVALALSASVAGGTQDEYTETFDQAWSIIEETHWDPDFNGLDWDAVRDELRPRAAQAESIGELRVVINEMLARLGQSHFALWPREAAGSLQADREDGQSSGGNGDLGLSTVLVDEVFVVARVDADGPAWTAGVLPGWIVDSVDGVEVADVLKFVEVDEHKRQVQAQRLTNRRLSGPPGSAVEIVFRDAEDGIQERRIEFRAPRGTLSRFGNMPPLFARLDSRIVSPDVNLEIGVIAFNIWLPVLTRPFDEAIDAMRATNGIILDLRGNPGGLGAMVMGFGGHFVADNVSLGTMRTRQGDLHFRINPRLVDTKGQRVEPFDGPLAILLDATSASTSEVFAGGLQAIGRARVFGQRSMGAVLPSLMDELANGDILQHAFADFTVSEGELRLEGRGVIPDHEIIVTRADLLGGGDPSLEAALEWIAQQQ